MASNMNNKYSEPMTTPAAAASAAASQSSQPDIAVVVTGICLACTMIMVSIRIYTHKFVVKQLRWDDGAILLSLIGVTGYSVNLIMSRRFDTISKDPRSFTATDIYNLKQWGLLMWISSHFYILTVFCAKLAVLMLYNRLFVPRRSLRPLLYYAIMVIIAFNALFYLSTLVAILLTCVPVHKIWDPRVPGHCIDYYPLIIATAGLNALSDILMIIIPAVAISRLQMPRKRKLEALFIFGFGLISVIIALVRLGYSVSNLKRRASTRVILVIRLWSLAECTACIIAACVPMVPALIRHHRGSKREYSRGNSNLLPAQASMQSRDEVIKSGPSTTVVGNENRMEDPIYQDKRHLQGEEGLEEAGCDLTSPECMNTETNIVVHSTVDVSSVPTSYCRKHGLW